MATEFRALMDEGHLSLSEVIAHSVRVAEAFLETINDEQRSLAGTDHTALTALFARKSELATALNELDQRQAHLIAKYPSDEAVNSDTLARYRSLLEQCREGNAINGRLVQDRQRHVRQALGILRGQPHDEPDLYSQQGASVPAKQSQDLGRA